MKVAIVGAGFSGIGTAIALEEEGVHEYVVLERSDGIGGVWHHNTYPGAACDVPSYLYSYSYEQRRDWTQPCSPQEEILRYIDDTARKHRVLDKVRFGCEVVDARWDDTQLRWTLTVEGGERVEADALVVACGQLSRPRWPSIPGRDTFEGHEFHSAEWDHDHDLRGKRVAVVGTGASAVQFVPPVAEEAAHLDVYQRTAPYMLPRRNPRYPKLVRSLIANVPGLQSARRLGMEAFMELCILALTKAPPLRRMLWAWSAAFMRLQVRDPELRRKTWPDYPIGCKRILFSSYYLPALGRPDVELVTDRIARITPRGVLTEDGVEREVDTIIWGTGFDADAFVLPMHVHGVEGRELQEVWDAGGGPHAHLGLTVAGFPNMFLMYGPNTNLGVGSIIVMIEAQVRYVMSALRRLRATGATALDLRPEVLRTSDVEVQDRLKDTVWTQCRSWYRQDGTGRIVNNWPGFMAEYVKATRELDPVQYQELRLHSEALKKDLVRAP
ncbi:NAD(P)/FAD-dependent oxidoreductase [Conexibacter sp. SYSU D00693]|uniref:flavin-containing monooxygenase n=1 Tax=Conexibacter sp. SYSU D00693 TaxID=2812560 RepID=UPI00196B66D9|nr:NAD(P)/FAD-dependent oxidoreductase [Conexibacter sp. SYSU D00693]